MSFELPSVTHHDYKSGETMDFDQQVSEQVTKLLQSYGSDAVTCLNTLASLIKDRLDQQEARKAEERGDGRENDTNNETSDISSINVSLRDSLTTAGNVESIVLQTIQMEQGGPLSTNFETLVQAGINVLRYWSTLQPSSTDPVIVNPICEFMSKFPKNETIQESACVRLSKQMTLLVPPVSAHRSPASAKTSEVNKVSQIQRIGIGIIL